MTYKDRDRQREYQREWVARRRADWLAKYGPCIDCGSAQDLQVDHADAAIRVSHRVWSWRQDRREVELAKCVVRCQPCHARKTTASGEHAKGIANGKAKLNDEIVLAIRAAEGTATQRKLAAQFGTTQSTVRDILSRRTWRHL